MATFQKNVSMSDDSAYRLAKMLFGLDRGEFDIALNTFNERYFQPIAQFAKALSAMLSPLLEAIARGSISLAQKIEAAPEIPSYEKLLIEKAGYGRLMARLLAHRLIKRVYECFADFAEGNAFWCLMQRGLEALDRFAKGFGAEAESLMMDRHDEMSASFIGHLHGLFRSAMRMNPGIVSADRHDRQIDGPASAQLCKRIAQRGVSAKNDATVISLENVAVITAIGIAPLPRAPMFDAECDDVDLAGGRCYRLYFVPTQFAHVAEPCPTKQITCPQCRDHRGRTIKSMERAHVEMIEVRVGKKHDVDLGEVANCQRGRDQPFRSECESGQPDSDPRKKNWISENLYPEKID
jgi:hypothetical protein